MNELIKKNLPNILRNKKVLFSEPSAFGMELFNEFKAAEAVIDVLEPGYREYHKAMLSGNYRLVINDALSKVDLEIEYDMIYQEGEFDNLDILIERTREWTRLLVLLVPNSDKYKKEAFLLKRFEADVSGKHILAWRTF